MILQWLTSPEWANVVKALLHTLWQGAVIAVLLGFALRRLANPVTRYRCSLAALGGVMLAGLVTWAVLNRPLPQSISHASALAVQPVSVPMANNNLPPLVVNFSPHESRPAAMPWSAWLAMFWLAGATAMIFRAGFQVAGAEQLRRSSRPLEDARIAGLLDDARRAVGLARRVRIAVTDKLTSPAVVGVLVPTLIVPLSLTTMLTPEQIRFVLLHELAHIRRGDYFAGLFQLFAEALLFFNPAVWWISRQMRIEREACCDALAIELSGAPADYARTLVRVAENVLSNAPLAAPAFGDKREPSSLADRVQRMLVPGYRPKLRLTWRAMLLALFVGGGLLFLSALGTRVTVAAILSPQERIERIEKKMTEYGAEPQVLNGNGNDGQASTVKISGRVRMADGSQVPKWVYLNVNSTIAHSSYGTAVIAKNGLFTNSVRAGTIYLGVEVTNCAPALIGPLDGFVTNRFENLELVCEPGFDVSLQPVDAETGQPVTNAKASTIFWMNNNGFQYHFWKSGADGSITLTHCADLPMDAIVNAPGYEIVQQRFDHPRPGEVLRMELRRGGITTGTVVDKITGEVLAGATLRLIYEKGRTEAYHQWTDEMRLLAQTDADGRFTLNQLASGTKYWIGVSAPGHESVVVSSLTAGAKDASIKLGPELVVRGRVIGKLDSLQKNDNAPTIYWSFNEAYGNNSCGDGGRVPLRVDDSGVARFQFTNRLAAKVTLTAGERTFERNVDAPVDDWVIDLSQPAPTNAPVQSREVVLRFQSPSGVAPKGTVYVTVPYRMDAAQPSYQRKEVEIQNGEVHVRTFPGAFFDYAPAHTVGFWFKQSFNQTIDRSTNPLVIDIPVVPAGAIFAHAKNADGSPAGGLLFTVEELKRSPQRDAGSPLSDGSDGVSDNAPRKWASGPLPLGGTYEIIAWRGNSFCASQPVKLTDAQPDAEVELQFPPGKSFTGEVRDAGGQPVRNGEVEVEFIAGDNHSFALKSVFTDEQGRFRVDDATPGIGKYILDVSCPGCRAERFDVDFSRLPMVLRLQRGRPLAGRVVEARTGYVIPDAEIRAWTDGVKLQPQTMRTDADGRFEFTTLGDEPYHLYVSGAEFGTSGDTEYKTGQTNLLLKVKPYPGGQLAPKAPTAKTSSENVGTTANVSSRTNAFEKTVEPGPLVQDALLEYEAGKLDEAETTLNFALMMDPENATAKNYLKLVQATRQSSKTNQIQFPAKIPAASEITATFKLDPRINLNDLKKSILDASVAIPPTLFFDKDNGLLLVRGSKEQLALVNRLVLKLNGVSTNEIEADSKRFVSSFQAPSTTDETAINLFTRMFKVDANIFPAILRKQNGLQTSSVPVMAKSFFSKLGVDWESPNGKRIFFNDGTGILLVRATEQDLDTIDRALQVINTTPPQIHIKVRFVEVTQDDRPLGFDSYLGQFNTNNNVIGKRGSSPPPNVPVSAANPLGVFPGNAAPTIGGLSNSAPAIATVTGILTDPNFRVVLHALENRPGVELLGEPEGVTTSGRQMQMRTTTIIDVVTNLGFGTNGSVVPQTKTVETGPVLDVVPYVLSDGYTINLALIPSDTEFLGYDKPTKSQKVLPRFTVRQVVTTLNLWDGQTAIIGALPEKDYVNGKEVSDKSKSSDKLLLIFVTATIVDPAGNRIHSNDELPFTKDGVPPQPPPQPPQ